MPSAGFATPKATTQPRRIPSTPAAASSISCGTRLRPPLMIEVLAPAGHVDLAVGAVGEVAAVEPAAGQGDGGGGLGLAVVAARHRGAAEDEASHDALAHVAARLVDEPQPRARAARVRPTRISRAVASSARPRGTARPSRSKGARATRSILGPRPERREARAPRSTRRDRRPGSIASGRKPQGREAAREALERAPGSPAPRRSRPRARTRGRAPRAPRRGTRRAHELVGEVRGRGERRRAAGGSPSSQRSGRARKAGGEQQGEREAVVQAEQPGADQAHVVVERQPAHPDVGRAAARRPAAMARMLASRLSWVSSDALGLAGAAGGVLDEGGSRSPRRRGAASGSPERGQLVRGHDVLRGPARAGAAAPRPAARAAIVTSRRTPASARIADWRGRVLLQAVEAQRAGRSAPGSRRASEDAHEGAQEVQAGRAASGPRCRRGRTPRARRPPRRRPRPRPSRRP